MAKDWLPWIGGRARRRRRISGEIREAAATSGGGCLRAVFHLFDFPANQDNSSTTPEQVTITTLKGLEAPRNSLELGEEESCFNIPVRIQIKTSTLKSKTDDGFSDSSSSSPGIRTPGVVARLMGLDLIPECNSPSISSTSKHRTKSCPQQKKPRDFLQGRSEYYEDDISIGAQSLPETPRISSSSTSARRSDFELHRLSLQINTGEKQSASWRRRSRLRQLQDENASPGHYAKQIVNQVKERISRRVGQDITNTVRNQDQLRRRDENLIPLKPINRNSNINSNQLKSSPKTNQSANQCLNSSTSLLQGIITKPKSQQQNDGNCSSSGVKKLNIQSAAIRKRKQATFVHSPVSNKTGRKCRKTPLPKLPQKQLFGKQSHPYNQPEKRPTVTENVPSDSARGRTAGDAAAEYGDYIRKILDLAGVASKSTAVNSIILYTSSHAIDPLIFRHLELLHLGTGGLSRRCNRKLIFQLVDEQLAEILKPYFNRKPCISSSSTWNPQIPLADELCRRIDGFPAANCAVLEDIDSLINWDWRKSRSGWLVEEEGDAIVGEIEGEIVEQLIRETAAAMAVGRRLPRNGNHVTL